MTLNKSLRIFSQLNIVGAIFEVLKHLRMQIYWCLGWVVRQVEKH